ncbi:MAG: ADP-ribosylglycohydrolase family protein [Clostridia bacterium]|nr:ADP-ribosylglycohydrolase family protein [Clostridia bacterium]
MPGYANWKQLFDEELFQMREEGYDLRDLPSYGDDRSFLLPFPGCEQPENDTDVWQKAYEQLASRLSGPLRADYPYTEPNGWEEILASAAPMPELEPLPDDEYVGRLRGAVYGRFAAVILGKPLEMGLRDKDVRAYLEGADAWPLDDFVPAQSPGSGKSARKDCIASTRGNIHYAQSDDDIHYTLLALLLAEKYGLDFKPEHVGRNWLDNIPYHWCWCASRQAYYHMINQVPVRQIPTLLNPWRECIDGQIRTDLWGYIAPGDPVKAALGAYRDCSFSLVKNGIYGGMFTAGCIAAALTANPTVDRILDGGLAIVPQTSRLAEMVRLVRGWYRETPDRQTVCDRIMAAWGHLPFAATINNMAIVVLAILDGGMDYSKTITSAVCCGLDTDCNAGTAGSIIGAAVGIDGVDERWYGCLNDTAKTAVASVGEIKISEIVRRIGRVKEKLKSYDC